MSNMSYCRFQNTSSDLADCEDALGDLFTGDCAPLSDEELRAAKSLANSCLNILLGIADQAGVEIDCDDLERAIDQALDTANRECANG